MAEGYIARNPVTSIARPKDRRVREDMRPLPAPEFDEAVKEITDLSPVYGDLLLVLGRTGLRWDETRATQVRDFAEVPIPVLHVVRDQPEGSGSRRRSRARAARLRSPTTSCR